MAQNYRPHIDLTGFQANHLFSALKEEWTSTFYDHSSDEDKNKIVLSVLVNQLIMSLTDQEL